MNDDITVVIPCFNYGDFLQEAIASALEQSGGAPAIIVVDDGSTDPGTQAVLERLPDGVRLVRQQNAGVAAARNAALPLLATPYVIMLDADDRLGPGALAALRAPLDADPSLGFSFGIMRFFGEWEGVLRLPPYDPFGLLYRHTIGLSALMRRQVFEDVGGFDPAFGGYEDWEFWVAALRHGWEGRFVEAETVLYRRHGDSRHFAARYRYRETYRQLRRKYPDLYGVAGRRRLAAGSRLGRGQRWIYRFWWGPRPLPARLEIALQGLLWKTVGSAGAIARSASRRRG
jgi:glycosyltransferase involved in cell wall biosynthesis